MIEACLLYRKKISVRSLNNGYDYYTLFSQLLVLYFVN